MKSALIAIAGVALLSSAAARVADFQQTLARWSATVQARSVRQDEVHLVRQGFDDSLPTAADERIGADGEYCVRIDRKFDSDEIVLKGGHAEPRLATSLDVKQGATFNWCEVSAATSYLLAMLSAAKFSLFTQRGPCSFKGSAVTARKLHRAQLRGFVFGELLGCRQSWMVHRRC